MSDKRHIKNHFKLYGYKLPENISLGDIDKTICLEIFKNKHDERFVADLTGYTIPGIKYRLKHVIVPTLVGRLE